MTIGPLLNKTINELMTANIATARLDALVLLENELGQDRSWIIAHFEDEAPKLSKKFIQSVRRRINHEPLAYIIGKSEFYGREFTVSNHTLVPRPETETMIELAKKYIKQPARIVDVGCGSGAIGLTILLENITTQATLIDIDNECLKITKQNAKRYRLNVPIIKSDLLSNMPVTEEPMAVLANLPYVPESHTINKAAMHEPKHAIFGGTDGLKYFRELFTQASRLKTKLIFTESLPFQHQELRKIAEFHNYKQIDEDDFIQVFARP